MRRKARKDCKKQCRRDGDPFHLASPDEVRTPTS
jgi:hypothetical protein